ncbi:unnamed protein product [Closterium sp. NIES-53]
MGDRLRLPCYPTPCPALRRQRALCSAPRHAASRTPCPAAHRAASCTPCPAPRRAAPRTPFPAPCHAGSRTPCPAPHRAASRSPCPAPCPAALRVVPCCSPRVALYCPARRALLQPARSALLPCASRPTACPLGPPRALPSRRHACPLRPLPRPPIRPAAGPAFALPRLPVRPVTGPPVRPSRTCLLRPLRAHLLRPPCLRFAPAAGLHSLSRAALPVCAAARASALPCQRASALPCQRASALPCARWRPALPCPSRLCNALYCLLLAARRPALAARRPALATRRPDLAARCPALAARRPALATNRPALAALSPALAARRPDLATRRPALAALSPDLAARRPPLVTHHPPLAARRPALATRSPALAARRPTLTVHRPNLPYVGRLSVVAVVAVAVQLLNWEVLAVAKCSCSGVRVRPLHPSSFVGGLLSVGRLSVVAVVADARRAEGDCYLCVPPDLGIEAATLGASESALSGTGDTTVTPLSAPVAVSLAVPSGGLVLARSSTVLPCPAVPSSSLSGLHLPSFSTNLVSNAVLQDQWVDTFTPGGLRVAICQQAGPCSCRALSHQTLLWHHRLGHPSVARLHGMHSRLLVSGLPRSLPPLPPSPAPPCLPCIEVRQRAAPHSSSFPSTTVPLQTLHLDVWGPARVRGQGHERYLQPVVDDYTRYTPVFPLDPRCLSPTPRATFTLPASPQQNGIAKRRIGSYLHDPCGWPPFSVAVCGPLWGASAQPLAMCLLAGDLADTALDRRDWRCVGVQGLGMSSLCPRYVRIWGCNNKSTAASTLVAELVGFAAACRLDYATSLVTESESVCPQSVGGECALGTDVLEDRQKDFECFAAAVPHLVSMLIAPEGDPDAPDIPTPSSYAEAIEGPYSSQWQSAMDAEMASWKSTGTYVDEVPQPGANIVSVMWIFRVKRPPGSPPVFKARYVAQGSSQRQGVDFFHTLSPTPKMTTLRPARGDLAAPPTWLHWVVSTRYPVEPPAASLRQAPREWHDTLRTTLAALGFAPSTADPSLFLRTDTSLPTFYILVYVNDLVFATADTAGLAHVKSELQKRHTCTDLGELRSYLGLQIIRDRARRTITLTQSYMVQQVLQRFRFEYSSPQSTPLPTGHSLSALPSDESVEPSGMYLELVGCLMYLMTCTRPDLPYPLSILPRYVAPGRRLPEHWKVAKRVMRYLCSTSGMGLVLGGRARVVLTGHADASWVDDFATQRSSQRYTFSVWQKRQFTTLQHCLPHPSHNPLPLRNTSFPSPSVPQLCTCVSHTDCMDSAPPQHRCTVHPGTIPSLPFLILSLPPSPSPPLPDPNLSRTPASVCPSDFDCLAPSLHPDTVHPSLSHSHLPQPLPRLPTHLLAITHASKVAATVRLIPPCPLIYLPSPPKLELFLSTQPPFGSVLIPPIWPFNCLPQNLFSPSPPSSPCFPQPATLTGTHGLIPYSTVSHIPPPIIRLQLPPPVPSQALIPFSHPASIRIRNGVFHPHLPLPHRLLPHQLSCPYATAALFTSVAAR